MARKNTAIIILLAVLLTASVGFGTFRMVSTYLRKTDTASETDLDSAAEEGVDLIGKVVFIGSDYLSIEQYTSANPEAEISYETLNLDTLTATGENRFVILRSNAKYYWIGNGERNAVTVTALSIGDFIAVTLDEYGAQNILLLSGGSQ